MLRAATILCLAVAAMADTIPANIPEQVIRFGSIGTTFANIKGVLNPVTPVVAKGIPAFEFVRVLNGVPTVETDKYTFRCSVISDFYVPHDTTPKPVLLCRNDAVVKADSTAENIAFLFSAENIVIPKGTNEIELNFGKSVWKSYFSAHVAATELPKMRVRRQFGFGGSGAQASASSFGGGGGFGGFPGGGFGGGFSGSQAYAGAGSFGSGGFFG